MAKKSGKSVTKKAVSKAKNRQKLPNVYLLSKSAAELFWQHRILLAGIVAVYGLLNLVLVQGIAGNTDLGSVKDALDQAFKGNYGTLASGLGVFVVLLGSSGNATSGTAGAYQMILAVIGSLAIIWALRQSLAGNTPRVRDAFYKGMYPLVPFILVLIVIGLQLLPLLIGTSVYSLVITNGIAYFFIEKLIWAGLAILLSVLSLYMISSSLFALYVVTLPDMTPVKALRSARDLVRYRRWAVLRKLLFLPVLLLVIAAVIMLPIIVWLTPLAKWIFFVLTMFSLLAIHAYLYNLYRELLND